MSALDTGGAGSVDAVRRVDDAVVVGLQALGFPRGPVRRVLIEGGLGPYGRKEPDCTLVLYGDQMRTLIADPRGSDSTFRTWVHESIHARQPYVQGYEREYLPNRGYEEGLAEGLARWVVRDMARMAPRQVSYQYYVVAYQALAKAFGLEVDQLWRRLWMQPLGAVRLAFADVVNDRRQEKIQPALTVPQFVRLQGVADQLFDFARRDWTPNEDAMMATWRTVFR